MESVFLHFDAKYVSMMRIWAIVDYYRTGRNQRHQAKRQGLCCGTYVISHARPQIMAWCAPKVHQVAGSTFVKFSTTQYLFCIHKSKVVLVDVLHFLFIKYMNEHTTY